MILFYFYPQILCFPGGWGLIHLKGRKSHFDRFRNNKSHNDIRAHITIFLLKESADLILYINEKLVDDYQVRRAHITVLKYIHLFHISFDLR